MEVWLEELPESAKPHEADDRCPYCLSPLKVKHASDCSGEPDEATCPVCGEDVRLLIEWDPSIGLFKRLDD